MNSRVITIDNIHAPELQVYASLNEANLRHYYEPDGGLLIAESLRVIARAFDHGLKAESVLLEEKYALALSALDNDGACDPEATVNDSLPCALDAEELSALARIGKDIPVYTAPLTVLEQITGYKLTRGALAAMKRPPDSLPSDVCHGAKHIVVFEHITNPTNVGALFRSAAALGADAVLLTNGSADPFNRRAIRVSMGTVFRIPWAYTNDPFPVLKEQGFTTIALALTPDALPLDDPSLFASEKKALFLGSEDTGISPETLSLCDRHAIIPMKNGVDSLNVAHAAAIAFYVLF